MKTVITAAAIALAFTAAPFTAHAEPQGKTVAVSYADLNLSSATGLETLDRRIERAIEKVCGSPVSLSVREAAQARRCMDETSQEVSVKRDLAVEMYGKQRFAKTGRTIRFAVR